MNWMKLKRSKNKMIERFLQGFLIIILVILTIFMMLIRYKEMQELLTMQALFEERHKEKLS